MENILNTLREELIEEVIDENLTNIVIEANNNDDEVEEELDEYILAVLVEVDGDNGLQIHTRNSSPARIQNYFEQTIPQYNDDQFYSQFRMRRDEQFLLHPHI